MAISQTQINSIQELAKKKKKWKRRLLELKALNASTKAALLSELKNVVTQPLRAFGFGVQQTSGFGLSGFPVNSSSNRASSFSFKTSSSLGASSGNAPAFGSSSAASNAPAFATTSSPSVSRSAGFGSLARPSAASFSFKPSERTSAFGSSGFSGFGNSAAVKTSSTTPLTAFGARNAAVSAYPPPWRSTGFGKTAGASGQNVTAFYAGTNRTGSSSSYTPLNELTPEELKQFKAKAFEPGKIPLRPPPIELIYL